MGLFLEYGYTSFNKYGEELCGDMVSIVKKNDYTTLVLADGLGSGVKANILATLTSKILSTMVSNNIPMEECVETIVQTLPVCKERGVAYSTFSAMDCDDEGNVKITIKSGTYKGGKTAVVNAYSGCEGTHDNHEESDPAKLYIEGGAFHGAIVVCEDKTCNMFGEVCITGGTFDNNPTNYLAEGYKATKSGETGSEVWTVTAALDKDESGAYLIDNVADLAEFRDEVNSGRDFEGKTVKLTANITLTDE